MKILIILLTMMFITSCTTDMGVKATHRSVNIAGTKVAYKFQSCSPSFKWDGYSVQVDGLEFPNNDKSELFKFTVGKIGYDQKVLRDIEGSIARYDSLIQSTCATLVRLEKEENILKYSNRRDDLFERLIKYMEALDSTNVVIDAIDETKSAKSDLKDIE